MYSKAEIFHFKWKPFKWLQRYERVTISEKGIFNPWGKQFGSTAKQVEKPDLISSKSATTWATWETAFQPNTGRHHSVSPGLAEKKLPKPWDNSEMSHLKSQRVLKTGEF